MFTRLPPGTVVPEWPGKSWDMVGDLVEQAGAQPNPNLVKFAANHPYVTAWVENESGADVTEFTPLKIKQPSFSYPDPIAGGEADESILNPQVLRVEEATSETPLDQLVFATQPIANNEAGLAIVFGVFPARVNIVSDSDTTCGVNPSELEKLKSGEGEIPIVWKPAGTGDKWCLVRLGGGGGDTGSENVSIGVVLEGAGRATDTGYPPGSTYRLTPKVGRALPLTWDAENDRFHQSNENAHQHSDGISSGVLSVPVVADPSNAWIASAKGVYVPAVDALEEDDVGTTGSDEGIAIDERYLEITDVTETGGNYVLTLDDSGYSLPADADDERSVTCWIQPVEPDDFLWPLYYGGIGTGSIVKLTKIPGVPLKIAEPLDYFDTMRKQDNFKEGETQFYTHDSTGPYWQDPPDVSPTGGGGCTGEDVVISVACVNGDIVETTRELCISNGLAAFKD